MRSKQRRPWRIAVRRWRVAAVLVPSLLLVVPGCAGRYIRIDEKGLTCVEAYQIAIAAVHRMNYVIDTSSRPTPGAPGVITATHTEGTATQGLLVQVFCTTLGTAIEAKTDQGGLADLNFPAEFRRSFETAAASHAPQREPASSGLDVLVTPEHSNAHDLGVDVSGIGVLPVYVRISNRSTRIYGFRVKDVVLKTEEGERATPLKLASITQRLSPADADTLRQKLLVDRDVQAGDTANGFLLFPFKAYVRARVLLIDRGSNEPEGFAIDF